MDRNFYKRIRCQESVNYRLSEKVFDTFFVFFAIPQIISDGVKRTIN